MRGGLRRVPIAAAAALLGEAGPAMRRDSRPAPGRTKRQPGRPRHTSASAAAKAACRGQTASQTSADGASSAAVYLLSKARPAAAPATRNQVPLPVAIRRARAAEARGPEQQQRRVRRHDDGAGVHQQRAVQHPGRRVAGFAVWRHDRAQRASAVACQARPRNGPSSRTPSGVSPASAVPARIHRATMGGWSR